MVGEAVRGWSVVARLFGRMVGIRLAVGDVTATNSVYEKRDNMGTLQVCTVTPHVCRPARRKLSSSQRANCYLFGATSDISWNKVSQG
jgi:hypothetical protein